MEHSDNNVLPPANKTKSETANELDEDQQILRALQAYMDTTPGEPPAAESALRDIERKLDEEVKTSEQVATEWTEALSPILHGDEPQAVKSVFHQFGSWAAARRKARQLDNMDKVKKA